MSEENTFINFAKEAFLHPVNLGMLLVVMISAFVTSDQGYLPHIILTMSFGIELMYLGIVSRLPRFRKKVKMKKLHDRSSAAEEKSIFSGLDHSRKKQFLVLKHLAKLIKQNFDKLPYSSQGLLGNISKKIGALISNYLILLDLHNRYQLYINTSVEDKLTHEIQKEQQQIKNIDSKRLKRSKVRRIEILRKRLNKFTIAKEKYLICKTQLETIEDAIHYIYEQSMTMSKADDIGFQLDNLLEEVEETSKIVSDLDQDIMPFQSDLDDMDLDYDFLEMEKKQQKDSEQDSINRKRVNE